MYAIISRNNAFFCFSLVYQKKLFLQGWKSKNSSSKYHHSPPEVTINFLHPRQTKTASVLFEKRTSQVYYFSGPLKNYIKEGTNQSFFATLARMILIGFDGKLAVYRKLQFPSITINQIRVQFSIKKILQNIDCLVTLIQSEIRFLFPLPKLLTNKACKLNPPRKICKCQ